MYLSERQSEIVDLAKTKGRVLVDELAIHFDITPQTIRMDLNSLCNGRVLVRFHGGAIYPDGKENVEYEARRQIAADEKRKIGLATAKIIPNNASLFINIGTTTEAVGQALANHSGLMVVTNNI
ncbi:MAG: DeoR/GlpR family DNA-binding transcription regulator, partial [Sneathiella sp.]